MEAVIHFFIFVPVIGFLITLLIPEKEEATISYTAFGIVGINLLMLVSFTLIWLARGAQPLSIEEIMLYKTKGATFSIDFYLDTVSVVYLFVGTILTLLVTIYSRYYMHREQGYKRFFSTILFFFSGYSLTVLSGNFETLFMGWEVLGISSFLLITFYRQRYLPVKNGLKVYSIYRIGDVGILMAMWLSHHLWHENITFMKLNNQTLVHEYLSTHSLIGVFIALSLLVSACAKSAQFPFTSWLPRAMEGPTPSTAIFYGSLSVHIGAFLLFRTYPLWEYQYSVRIVIAGVGLTTAVVSTCIARVQSSVKSQIAYASAAQIGLIFIEVAAGLQSLALMHFAGNAFLRTYQLLVSPSVVSYLIKEQFYHFVKPEKQFRSNWVKRLNYTVYLWSIKEFNLDWFMYRFLWGALKSLGRFLSYFRIRNALIVYSAVLTGGVFMLYHQEYIPSFLENYMSVLLATLALVLVLRSFVERKSVLLAWLLIMLSHGFIVLSVLFNEFFEMQHSLVYLSGVLLAGIGGLACYFYLKSHEVQLGLNQFYGLTAKYKKTAFVFLLCCLGISGFPITPTFIGEDLVLSHVHQNQLLLAFILSVNLIVGGITVLRIYTRIFLGSFIHQQEDAALRSA